MKKLMIFFLCVALFYALCAAIYESSSQLQALTPPEASSAVTPAESNAAPFEAAVFEAESGSFRVNYGNFPPGAYIFPA